eukprot:363783-Chlamydomonas_euryale.AAC.4
MLYCSSMDSGGDKHGHNSGGVATRLATPNRTSWNPSPSGRASALGNLGSHGESGDNSCGCGIGRSGVNQ